MLKKYFPPEAKERMMGLVDNLMKSLVNVSMIWNG